MVAYDIKLFNFLANMSQYKEFQNLLGILFSFGILTTLLYFTIASPAETFNTPGGQLSAGILLGAFLIVGLILSLANFNIYINKATALGASDNIKRYLVLFAAPQFFFDLLMSGSSSLTGTQKTMKLSNDSLAGIGEKYSGRVNQIVNLGKDDSGFLILNRFRMQKRPNVMLCNYDSKNPECVIRRSVVYTTLFLTLLLLIPLFVVLGEEGDFEEKQANYYKYLSILLSGTFGIAIIAIFGTIKNAAGSGLFYKNRLDDITT